MSPPPFNDGGVAGSKIALFGCPAKEALSTIGKIEIAEKLPHPILDGVWGKSGSRRNRLLSHHRLRRKGPGRRPSLNQESRIELSLHRLLFRDLGAFQAESAAISQRLGEHEALRGSRQSRGDSTGSAHAVELHHD